MATGRNHGENKLVENNMTKEYLRSARHREAPLLLRDLRVRFGDSASIPHHISFGISVDRPSFRRNSGFAVVGTCRRGCRTSGSAS